MVKYGIMAKRGAKTKPFDGKYAYIYTLTDPRDGIVRYVGSAQNAIHRFSSHRNHAHSEALTSWILELRRKEMEPLLAVVRMVPAEVRFAAERELIAQHSTSGLLLNKRNVPVFSPDAVDPNDFLMFRHEHELSERQLADLLPVDIKTLQAWECGQESPPHFVRRALRHLGNEIRRAQALVNDPRNWFPCPHCGQMFQNRADIGLCMAAHVEGRELYQTPVSTFPQIDREPDQPSIGHTDPLPLF